MARLGEECRSLADAGADRIQWDVMDGRFVPNLTFGPDVIAACRQVVDTPFEAHLMVVEPDKLLPRYVDAGCELVIVHAETCVHLHRTLDRIRELGARAGVALNPHSPECLISHVLAETDMILVMTVNPGFGGQRYIASMEPKIGRVRQLIDASGHDIELEVDGGITDTTIGGAAAAGADVFISGSWLFNHPDGRTTAIAQLRERAMDQPG
jgi:ribulose-phosphate 3-epimerase